MFTRIIKNKHRRSYRFTKNSAGLKRLSDVPNSELAPVPYIEHIEKDLRKIEKEFGKKVRECKTLDLDTVNSTMFDMDIENAKARPLAVLQGQVGIHQRMINEVVLNRIRNNEINERTLEEKIKQRNEIDDALADAVVKLTKRDLMGGGYHE